jgi:hypothetical protein
MELTGLNHLEAHLAQDRVLPAILRTLRGTAGERQIDHNDEPGR